MLTVTIIAALLLVIVPLFRIKKPIEERTDIWK